MRPSKKANQIGDGSSNLINYILATYNIQILLVIYSNTQFYDGKIEEPDV